MPEPLLQMVPTGCRTRHSKAWKGNQQTAKGTASWGALGRVWGAGRALALLRLHTAVCFHFLIMKMNSFLTCKF